MTAIVSFQDGNWSATGTWVGGVVPGNGDTVTLLHNVTITANVTVGSSPSTGGTPAIAFSTAVTEKVLTLNTGITLTLKGDMLIQSTTANYHNHVVCGAGSTVTLLPASGQRYIIDCENYVSMIQFNGSSGSRCTVKTDLSSGGLAGYIIAVSGNAGVRTATYTDFIDLGTSSVFGVQLKYDNDAIPAANIALDISNCTFTRCSFYSGLTGLWDGNLTFQSNVFSSSVSISTIGGAFPDTCASFDWATTGSAGVRLIDSNGFDKSVTCSSLRLPAGSSAFSNNILGALSYFHSTSTWPANTNFYGNVFYGAFDSTVFYGPIKDCFFANTQAANPHYVTNGSGVSAMSYTGCLFEGANSSNDGAGDLIFPSTNATLLVTGCISLRGSNGVTAGKLVSSSQASTCAVTANHNTFWAKGGETGMVGLDETTSSYAGEIASCQSNLVVSDAADVRCLTINDSGAGTIATDAVTLADYNVTWNGATGTCVHNGTSQAGVVGYNGLKVSTAGAFPNSQIGLHDFTVSSDPFIAKNRNLATWGTSQGADGTYSGAIALLLATPGLAWTATTGLFAWIRYGWSVTAPTLKNAGNDGVTIGALPFHGGSIHARLSGGMQQLTGGIDG